MKAYQLKIAIKNSHPPIWRRCIVPAGITFSQLSIILNKVMGWNGYHLSEFEFYHLGLQLREDDGFDDFFPYGEFDLLDSSKTYINEYMENQGWFTYTYDFGDDWQHRVTIEKIIKDYSNNYPCVLKFKGACPIEDCGGIEGYYNCLDIMNNPAHTEYTETVKWTKSQMYMEEYDMEAVNGDLRETCFVTLWKGDNRSQNAIYEDQMKLFSREMSQQLMQRSGFNVKDISLADILDSCAKDEIKVMAQNYGLNKLSSLKKADMVQKTVEKMLEPNTMRNSFLFLRDMEIEAFEKAMDFGVGYIPVPGEESLYDRLFDSAYIGIRNDDSIDVPIDVADLYHKINTEEFIRNRKRVSWLTDCFFAATKLYGVVPVKIMLKVANRCKSIQFNPISLLEFYDMIPEQKKAFVLMDDLFIHRDLLQIKDNYKNLMRCQGDKKYYIPTDKEIADISVNGYFAQDENIQRLIEFFKMKENVDVEDAQYIGCEIQNEICAGCDMQDIFEIINDWGISFRDENHINRFMPIINDVWNNTRMLFNRGFKPNELLDEERKYQNPLHLGRMPAIVPGSSEAARLLMEGKDEIQKMGFSIDFESNATKVPIFAMSNGVNGQIETAIKKIYPNDLCPCGSGKKYKKCCGKK